jgi:hypothetical protein
MDEAVDHGGGHDVIAAQSRAAAAQSVSGSRRDQTVATGRDCGKHCGAEREDGRGSDLEGQDDPRWDDIDASGSGYTRPTI